MFAILMPVLIGCLGLGIDMTMAVLEKQRLQAALDNGAVAAAVSGETDTDKLEDLIEAFVKLNTGYDVDGKAEVVLSPDGEDIAVTLSIEGVLDPVFADVFWEMDAMDITVDTGLYSPLEGVEVVMAVDLSGSMVNDIPALQDAAIAVIDRMETMQQDNPGMTVQVGLVPWDSQINLSPWLSGEDLEGEPYDPEERITDLIADWVFRLRYYDFGVYKDPRYNPEAWAAVQGGYQAMRDYNWNIIYNHLTGLGYSDAKASRGADDTIRDDSMCPMLQGSRANIRSRVSDWSQRKIFSRCILGRQDLIDCYANYSRVPSKSRAPIKHVFKNLPYDLYIPNVYRFIRRSYGNDLTGIEENIVEEMISAFTTTYGNLPVFPLTQDYEFLREHIGDLDSRGQYTVPAVGLVGAYMLLSPEAPFREGAPFRPRNVAKNIILMTDGRVTSHEGDAMAICEILRSDFGVTIYTVGFREGNDPGIPYVFISSCASSDAHMYTPETQKELVEAFSGIAEEIADLRFTR
ncbi:MAG: VWA domain-containing protein [Alphaproteobacteria bacterium]|jgi:hypothetical protein|nr:VWA domain-containing protein [Alphaproteobacteria bacterium]